MNTKKLIHQNPTEFRKAVIKQFGKTEKEIDIDVKVLRDWLKTQPHLPEIMSDSRIERIYILNKCSIERTKGKIDMYYTIRTLIPDFYANTNPKLPINRKIADWVYWVPMPKLTEDLNRITIFKINQPEEKSYDMVQFVTRFYNYFEVRLNEDYIVGDIQIFDLGGFSMHHLNMLLSSPMTLKKSSTVTERVLSNRVNSLHFFNGHSVIQAVINMLKKTISPKLVDRIHIHKDVDEIFKFVPKSLMPKDYGGDEPSLEILNGLWQQKLEEYADRFEELERLRVNEKLRPEKLKNDEILGYHGNFKKLDVD